MTKTYKREYLTQYGVTDAHTHVCEWISDDSQSSIVAGLGSSEKDAVLDAENSAARGEFEIDGGKLVTAEIEG